MADAPETSRGVLAARVEGQMLRIPPLRPLFSRWPSELSAHKDVLQAQVNAKIRDDVKDDRSRRLVEEADVATVAARFWPRTGMGQLMFLTSMVMWAHIIEEFVERLPAETAAAQAFREDARRCWRAYLGLDPEQTVGTEKTQQVRYDAPGAEVEAEAEHDADVHVHPLIRRFDKFGESIALVYDDVRRKILLDALLAYIEGNQQEAAWLYSDHVPTYRQRQENRLRSSGVSAFIAMSEFACGKLVPVEMATSEAWATLRATAVQINDMVNDLLSLKREFRDGGALNSVLLKFHEVGDLDGAVGQVVDEIRELVTSFDSAAAALLDQVADDAEKQKAVAEVVDAMRLLNTGNLEWSLRTKRYGLPESTLPDGTIELTLKR